MSLTSIILLVSCGFKPIYANKDGNKNKCDNFTVSSENYEEVGHKIRYVLQDDLNQSCIDKDKTYEVELKLDKNNEAVAIQRDREITRYNIILAVEYAVFESGKTKPIYTGNKIVVGGYDAVVSDYGTYSNEQDTFEKLGEELAKELSLVIAAKLKQQEDSLDG